MLRDINNKFPSHELSNSEQKFHKHVCEANKKYDDPYSRIRGSIVSACNSVNVFNKPFYGYPSDAINEYYRNGGM